MAARTTSPALTPALIAKMSLGGRGARGALNYDAEKEGARLLWTNLEGTTPRQWARQMKAFLSLNPRCRRGVDHVSLSLDPRLGNITDDQFVVAVKAWLRSMGYGDRAVVCHLHTDEPQLHVHLVICRIDAAGKVHADGGNWKRSHAAAVHAAEAICLQPLPQRQDATRLPAPTDSQVAANKRAKRRGTKVQNHTSAARIFEYVVSKSADLPELESGALEAGLELQIVRKSSGEVQGLNVRFTGAAEWLKASNLKSDRSLSWSRVGPRLARNSEFRARAQSEADRANAATRQSAAARVAAQLAQQPKHQVSVPDPAITPIAAHEAKEATMKAKTSDRPHESPEPAGNMQASAPPSFSASPSPNSEKRNDLERAAGQVRVNSEIEEELRSKSKLQLKRMREALAGEVTPQGHDPDAIERLLARLARLILRLLTLNQVILPPTESERRIHLARHSLKLVDAELQRRADIDIDAAPRVVAPAPLASPRTSIPFTIVRPHDARHARDRDHDQVARAQDAARERNRK